MQLTFTSDGKSNTSRNIDGRLPYWERKSELKKCSGKFPDFVSMDIVMGDLSIGTVLQQTKPMVSKLRGQTGIPLLEYAALDSNGCKSGYPA